MFNILSSLKPPKHWRENITRSIGELLGETDLEARLTEIRTVIERMDTRWDHGFITDEQKFLEQRIKLQQELEQLTPVDNNDLDRAVDLLTNFTSHWEACGDDIEAQSALVKQIVERVYVQDEQVVAMTLHSNCHLVLGHNVNGPTEYTVDPFLQEGGNPGNHSDSERYTCGDDGSRPLTCTRLIRFVPRHLSATSTPLCNTIFATCGSTYNNFPQLTV